MSDSIEERQNAGGNVIENEGQLLYCLMTGWIVISGIHGKCLV